MAKEIVTKTWIPTENEKHHAAEILAVILQVPAESRLHSLAIAMKVSVEEELLTERE